MTTAVCGVVILLVTGCASTPAWQAGGQNWRLEAKPLPPLIHEIDDRKLLSSLCKAEANIAESWDGAVIDACTVFTEQRCDIYVWKRNPFPEVLDHELHHCAGWRHDQKRPVSRTVVEH
ncbi:MAG TPA: hypothetical protein VLN59_13020 [Burkholderiales bacterium]|nr:hypothetical protein [Burkholderiales bacterium]